MRVYDDLVNQVRKGEKIKVTGVYKSDDQAVVTQEKVLKHNIFFVEAMSI